MGDGRGIGNGWSSRFLPKPNHSIIPWYIYLFSKALPSVTGSQKDWSKINTHPFTGIWGAGFKQEHGIQISSVVQREDGFISKGRGQTSILFLLNSSISCVVAALFKGVSRNSESLGNFVWVLPGGNNKPYSDWKFDLQTNTRISINTYLQID